MFEEDLDCFFDTDDFADEISIETQTGTVLTVGIFDNPSDAIEIYNTAIESVLPVVRVKTSSIEAVKVKDTLTHKSISYRIERIETGGTGISFLYLGK